MVKSPALRGMNGYSKVLEPWASVVFTSYASKSGGNCTLGASSRFTLPLPEMVTLSEAASCALTSFVESSVFIVKVPTPPPKDAGAPAGRGETFTVYALE